MCLGLNNINKTLLLTARKKGEGMTTDQRIKENLRRLLTTMTTPGTQNENNRYKL